MLGPLPALRRPGPAGLGCTNRRPIPRNASRKRYINARPMALLMMWPFLCVSSRPSAAISRPRTALGGPFSHPLCRSAVLRSAVPVPIYLTNR